jgi:magnesium chelatase family protein
MDDKVIRPDFGSGRKPERHHGRDGLGGEGTDDSGLPDFGGRARLAILRSRAQVGIEAPPVTVEVFLSGGLPSFSIVGLAETAVRESKDRVRGALLSSDFTFPQERIIVSLAPADMRKTGGRFDLAIALGILAASDQVPATLFDDFEFYGELGLNGELRAIPGALPAGLKAADAGKAIFVPDENGAEAALACGRVFVARSLLEVTGHLAGRSRAKSLPRLVPEPEESQVPDLRDVKGQQLARRALEIAAAGEHNILFSGPPGTGKSMLASRLPGILPPMTEAEALETAAVDSVLGRRFDVAAWRRRPFRAPHHTASAAALVGGGSDPRPGEISRAHNGVLFLDELPEFSRHVLEVLREPLETGTITISRAGRQADFPSRFQLVAAMNPCPCGYLGDPKGNCGCSADKVRNYRERISGPLLDRIDIQVSVQRLAPEALRPDTQPAEASAAVLERVCAARQRQRARANLCNARLQGDLLEEVCALPPAGWSLLEKAMDSFAMSARAHQRVRRVARTIADLAESERIALEHVGEALSLRQFDRGLAGVPL